MKSQGVKEPLRMDITKEYRASNVALVVCMALVAALFFATHSPRLSSGLPFVKHVTAHCFVKEHTGLTCKTCGLGQSIAAFCEGDLAKSRDYHRYGYLFVLYFCFQLCLRAIPIFVARSWLPWADMGQMVLGSFVLTAITGL
jgi:hypothetical protein